MILLRSRLGTLLIGIAAAGAAVAQSLPDPLRPAIGAGAAATDVQAGETPTGGGLQAVRIDRQGRKAALINGEWVVRGGKVGQSRLVAVRDDAVDLLGMDGKKETMKLYPDVEMTRSKTPRARVKRETRGAGQ